MSGKAKTNGSLAMSPKVITIPASDQQNTRRLRVAAYARVSSDSADQLHSFAAQNAYFSKLITENPAWELADIYADKGITGTSIDKREDFLRMMEDCRRGRIDRILVKSISRFGRNSKESLEAVRELNALGVSVLFEEQNIDTSKADGEMLTAIFAILAQKESESISEKMRMSYQMRMRQKAFLTNKAPYGYKLTGNTLEIIENEAGIIRKIFSDCLSGKSITDIVREINNLQIPTRDLNPYWQESTVLYILHNERYAGNALLQKTYTSVELPHYRKRNNRLCDQILIEHSHPAIISKDIFDKVQKLLYGKRTLRNKKSDVKASPFSRMMRCELCGATFKCKTIRDKVYWSCMTHEKSLHNCSIKQVPQSEIHQAFLRLYFKLKRHGAGILNQLLSDLRTARNGSLLWSEDIVALNKQISDIASQERLLAQLKQQGMVDPDIFISRGNLLAERRREIKRKKEQHLRAEEDRTIQQTEELLDILESGPDWLDSFDEDLFRDMVEKITVVDNEALRFRLINGMEVTEHIERTKR